MPVSAGSVVQMTPAMSPSGMSCTAAPAPRTPAISSACRGRSRMQAVISDTGTPLAFASATTLSPAGASRSTSAWRVAGADGDLVHVHVGRVQQAAALRHGEHGERVRHRLGADGRALERIDGDVDLGPSPEPTFSPM